jgi:hypothetical protein
MKILSFPADTKPMTKALGAILCFATLASPQSGMKEVTYEVDGSAKYANLTLTNQSGGTEQNQVKLPFNLKFYAKGGQSVYLSAQKAKATKKVLHALGDEQELVYDGIAGTVHVLIRVSGAVVGEASSDAPYGIATAKGVLPE